MEESKVAVRSFRRRELIVKAVQWDGTVAGVEEILRQRPEWRTTTRIQINCSREDAVTFTFNGMPIPKNGWLVEMPGMTSEEGSHPAYVTRMTDSDFRQFYEEMGDVSTEGLRIWWDQREKIAASLRRFPESGSMTFAEHVEKVCVEAERARQAQNIAVLPKCEHPLDAVYWNEFNKATQCHSCGLVLGTAPPAAERVAADPPPLFSFEEELRQLINRHSLEKHVGNTPDHILAAAVLRFLDQLGHTIRCRDEWYGRSPGLFPICTGCKRSIVWENGVGREPGRWRHVEGSNPCTADVIQPHLVGRKP